ncbi:Krueppel-like factor 5, partial [Lates japonicus]
MDVPPGSAACCQGVPCHRQLSAWLFGNATRTSDRCAAVLLRRSFMAAALTMSGGGGQEDPFYPLQKATLPAGFPLEDSALFGLDCKISETDKAGQNDYTQAKCEMDRYLSPQPLSLPPSADGQQKPHRDSTSAVDHFFADDHAGAPYTLNMNLYLPDVAYLRMGLCQQVRPPQHQNHAGLTQIKTESASPCFSPNLQPHCPSSTPATSSCSTSGHGPGGIAMETSAINMTLTGLPDFTSVFNQSGGGRASSASQQEQTAKPSYCGLGGGAYTHPHPQAHPHFLQQHVPYLPPSPPSSEPGSPDRQKELLHTMSPPPSYAATIASKLAGGTPGLGPSPGPGGLALPLTTGPGPVPGQAAAIPQAPATTPAPNPAQTTVPVRYSRRNNPDLEKRRIHHCDYP